MSEVVVHKDKRQSKWRWIAIAVAVLVVAGGAGLTARWWQDREARKDQKVISSIDKSMDASASGDYAVAHSELTAALNQPGISDEQKFEILLNQGVVFQNQRKYQDALDTYNKAGRIKQTKGLYEAIGNTAAEMGNKQLAIDSYKKAITLIPSNLPTVDSQKAMFEELIKQQGGQQ